MGGEAVTAHHRKLGKLAAKHDARTPWLSEFLLRHRLPKPQPFDWMKGLPFDLGMMGNDVAGDCTCAGAGHMIQVQTAANGRGVTPSTSQILDAYKAITLAVNGRAFDPADPSTDTGLALLDVLKYWRTNGIAGHKIGGFVKLRHDDQAEIEIGGRLFGGLYTGAQLPTSAEQQLARGDEWQATGDPAGTWGGHCMYIGAADEGGPVYATWGKRQRAEYGWVAAYADEMYAVIDDDWVTGKKPAPSGFDIVKLREFLGAL